MKRETKQRLSLLLIVAVFLLVLVTPAQAQTYAFSLDKEIVHVLWESDGSLSLAYEFVFTNAVYADPLDFVDVGIPTSDYSLNNISATINGQPVDYVGYSAYVSGVEVALGSNAIQAGQTGVVRVQINGIGDVLYVDSTDSNYASAVFSPTWFGSEFVSGFTDMTVVYHLPPGVQPDEPRWHRAPSGWPESPLTAIDNQGRITYTWHNPTASGSSQYLFGASFPASYVPASAINTPTLWQRLGIDPEALIGFVMMSIFCGVFLGIPALAIRSSRKRKLQYLPPKIAIEGLGIKRGLTAIEAAILLEQPMDKILTMMLFAVIKKGAASVKKQNPLTLDITDPAPQGLRGYETDFLEAMKETGKAKRKTGLQKTMVSLVRSVTKKMKGFSRKETRDYYQDIIERAWAQVETANTPEMKGEKYDEVMEWTLLDDDYDSRTRDVFHRQTIPTPYWWHHYHPTSSAGRSASRGATPTSRPTPGGAGLPNIPGSDFAAGVVNGVESFAAGVIGSVNDFTSGVTGITNPPPKPSSSSYRSSGGGSSCACACACAGCACACAGGGR